MQKVFIAFMLLAYIAASCKKENSSVSTIKDPAEIYAELDGETIHMVNKPNKCNMYSFSGVAGNYFGVQSSYEISEKVDLDITFGTGLTKNSVVSDSEFVSLIHPGSKEYGSLGSFSSNPQLKPGKVEIAFTDEHLRRWCSTQITEKQTPDGVEAFVKIEQKKGSFFIDEIEKTDVGENISGYRIKGHFECQVYEVNTDKKKMMKGNFTGVLNQHE